MKKLIAILTVGIILVAGVVMDGNAAKVRTIDQSRIVGLRIDVQWSNDLTSIVDVIVTAQSVEIDDAGARAGDTSERYNFNDLAPQERTALTNLIRFMGNDLAQKAVNENYTPTVPATMPGRP